VAYRELVDTVRQTQVDLELNSNYKVYPAIAGGPDNSVHVVWHGRSGPSGYYDVWYKARIDTTWGATENVSNGSRHQMNPSVAVDPVTHEPHAIWAGYEAGGTTLRVIHSYRTAEAWQTCDTLSEPGSSYGQNVGQLAFTSDGLGHAVWEGKSESHPAVGQIRYSQRSPRGTWSAPVDITDTTSTRERPSIASSPSGLHVVWSDYRDGNSEMYYKHDSVLTGVGEGAQPQVRGSRPMASIVRGVLTLPRDMTELPGNSDRVPRPVLLDVAGRKTMELCAGANDLRRLSPGVYLVREQSAPSSQHSGSPMVDVRKVVILK
jgi:hypothetical protein